ncbi:CAF17-like 4Fe-4S cluster assembly/insertion protein YgfZ [Anabaena sp. CS-542/02]|uniref:CAF17-like 4Fe-4S cluster assembly/insertion protein YgfZ n=1 Tax=Anabaena sp. CS-542/02 TaxID=3021719 RepID=UPI00232E68B0|nr:folate-binding protein [Anabaena sp. CS-542/02]MDB9445117.1 folate-binding protein [Anabaena sp. CS-542/02]
MSTSATDAQHTAAIQAATEGVAVCDRSHWGRIRVSDDDRIRFLHNQSTNDFHSLKPGQGCDTVMVSSTARTIDLVTAYILEDAVLLLTSPSRRELLMQWLDRYIFFADQVQLTDVTDETSTLSLMGAKSHTIVEQLGAGAIIGQAYGNHQLVNGLMIAVGSGLTTPGYTIIMPAAQKEKIWQQIVALGAVELRNSAWETLRILQGRPAPDAELTDDYNPLEVGLWQTISFNKGCYIGQETIARLNTYKGVKQHLWGIILNAPASVGSAIAIGDEKVGKLTSYTATVNGHFGLGYIRSKAGGIGLKVQIGQAEGEVVKVPFVSHQYPQ